MEEATPDVLLVTAVLVSAEVADARLHWAAFLID